MIAVIADDFTGAAEIGGIALRQGFKVTMHTSLEHIVPNEVIVLATDTRSQTPYEARQTIRECIDALLPLQPTFIYKKVDSVLRGNVAEELLEQMQRCKKQRVLLIPANPILKRVIKEGIYYENGLPLDRARFGLETEHENTGGDVISLIGKVADCQTTAIHKSQELPLKGLIIGDTLDEVDLDHWATQQDEITVMAGASSFFNALLKKQNKQHKYEQTLIWGKRRLFVCGSAFEKSREVVEAAARNGRKVAYMPAELCNSNTDREELLKSWQAQIATALKENEEVLIAVGRSLPKKAEGHPDLINRAFAEVVEQLVAKQLIDELLIEGGHTASGIIGKLGYQQFYPTQELAQGVIRMQPVGKENLFLTLKPGSYAWPEELRVASDGR